MATSLISERIKRLPTSPGVYLMKDAEGNILYVGKAANLRHRVSSYFGTGSKLTAKIQRMVNRLNDVDFLITSSEQEALILELNLIKRYRPRFNVRLKDDKSFPYLKIDLREDWPRIYFTRRLEQDGGYYFGPFASAKSVRQTIRVIKEIFPFRSCPKPITGADRRACLEYYIGRCPGPCIGAITRKEHKKVIKQIVQFLEGKQETIVRDLERQMNEAAEAMEFEKAALYRNRIEAIRKVIEGQRIAAKVKGEQDVIAFAQDSDQACVQVFFIRSGKLIGRESFVLQGTRSETPEQIMTSFIKQFYNSAPYVPPLILLQHPAEDAATIENWLASKRGGRVQIRVPQRGNKRQLMNIVAENARQSLGQLQIRQLAPAGLPAALAEVAKELRLPRTPVRMEGYDISNIQGKTAVGSMVVFEQGRPKQAHYRRFKIRTVEGANDYAMLQEVLKRRFKHVGDATDAWPKPDLILIDGGRGQLNAALAALKEVGAGDIPTASLAKENEEIFIPDSPQPIVLPRSSASLQLLQRLRDEAHRFALGYHQRLRKKETLLSVLDEIPGIGPKRRRALLTHFGSVQAIAEASLEDLAAVSGMNNNLAKRVKEFLSYAR